ncbi:FtsK/SpoIIIE domain-containing protein [Frankia canadensis]|uniref:FtsK/SpoIIIE domain-containing protein n=1 Tax=Frankia canadensis TaxID=1836972 RepID=UPI00105607E9|nr:FtsK/SpoIIIE domain-containing protein [Frankia canadensis]
MRAVSEGGASRDWSAEVGADAMVWELGVRLFGPLGEFGLVVEGESFGPDLPVAVCGLVDGVEVAPAEPVDGYRSGYGGGLTDPGPSASAGQTGGTDVWWESTAVPEAGGLESAAAEVEWWIPAPAVAGAEPSGSSETSGPRGTPGGHSPVSPSDPLLWSSAGAGGGGWELVIVAGRGVGRRLAVPGGETVSLFVDPFEGALLERGGDFEEAAAEFVLVDDVVTLRWAVRELTVDGEAAGNGDDSWDGGAVKDGQVLRPGAVLAVGSSAMRLGRRGGRAQPGQTVGVPVENRSTVAFHRTARPVSPPAPGVVTLPPVVREPGQASPFNWASLGAPLVLAGVLFTVTRQLMYALLSALGAIIVVFSFVENRLRRRREVRRSAAERAAELAAFDARLAEARRLELRRRWDVTPTAADWVRAADQTGATLWERGPTDSDFLDVFVAVGHLDWRPAVERVEQAGAEIRERVVRSGGLASVPLTFSLDRGELVTLRGPRPDVLGLVRAAICQACCAQGPAHLRIGLLVEDTTDWEWLKWLPHLRDETSGELRVRRIDATADPQRALDEAAAWLTGAGTGAGAASPVGAGPHRATGHGGRGAASPTTSGGGGGPAISLPNATSPERINAVRTLLIVDGPRLRPGSSLAFRRALAADASAIVVDGPPPNLTTTLIEIGPDGTVAQVDARTGRATHGASPAPLGADDAQRCARMLARLDDPLVAERDAPLPARVRLADLVPFDLAQPSDRLADDIRALWAARRDPDSLAIPVGLGEDGPFELDIVRHGPHGLLGGATGSGKSELLKMIVVELATRYSPDEVIIGLFDFKGGTSLQDLTALPHCVGLVSDTDLHAAERALRYLRTELLRRERLLFARGVQKIEQIAGELPRLLVIIDEFQILADELPDELATIIDLTKRGRSLGVHLLFATQSPTSVRNYDEIKRNTHLRMTLKLLDVEDSVRLIDLPDAARFTASGRGLARVDNRVLAFQAGYPSGPVEAAEDDAVRLTPFTLLPDADADAAPRTASSSADAIAPAGVELSRPRSIDPAGVTELDEPWWETGGTGPGGTGSDGVGSGGVGPGGVGPAAWVPITDGTGAGDTGVRDGEAGVRAEGAGRTEGTELSALIVGVQRAYRSALDWRQVRPVADVWPPALPASLTLAEVVAQARAGEMIPGRPAGLAAYFARGDRPDESEHARQPAVAWHLDAGNLLVFGAPGAGASTALTVLATSLTASLPPTGLHLYVLDFAGGDLRALGALPHCAGNVILGDELERQANLLAFLRARIARLGAMDAAARDAEAQSILLIDNLGGFMSTHEAVSSKQGMALLEDFATVIGAGPASKVAVAASIAGTRVRAEVAARAPQRLVLRLADRNAYGDLTIERRAIPSGEPGRGLWTTGNELLMEVQVAQPGPILSPSQPEAWANSAVAVAGSGTDADSSSDAGSGSGAGSGTGADAGFLPRRVRALPATVDPAELTADGDARLDGDVLSIPVGLTLHGGLVVPACLDLAEASPALIYGPPRCGKSMLLRRLAELTRAGLGDAVAIYAAAPVDSPLATCPAADRVRDLGAAATLAERAAGEGRPTLLLIDDVTRLGDTLNDFLKDRHPRVRLVATARIGELRTADYSGTASRLKSAPTRLVLEPEPGESDPVSGRYFAYPPSGPGRGRAFLLSATGTRFLQT